MGKDKRSAAAAMGGAKVKEKRNSCERGLPRFSRRKGRAKVHSQDFPQKEKKVEIFPFLLHIRVVKYIGACSRREDHVTVSQASVTRRDGT